MLLHHHDNKTFISSSRYFPNQTHGFRRRPHRLQPRRDNVKFFKRWSPSGSCTYVLHVRMHATTLSYIQNSELNRRFFPTEEAQAQAGFMLRDLRPEWVLRPPDGGRRPAPTRREVLGRRQPAACRLEGPSTVDSSSWMSSRESIQERSFLYRYLA